MNGMGQEKSQGYFMPEGGRPLPIVLPITFPQNTFSYGVLNLNCL